MLTTRRYTNTREEFGECEGPRPPVYKILRQPMNDPVFRSICAHSSSLAVFAHIRAASGETAITVFNNHPFTFGRWSFMHNGQFGGYAAFRRDADVMIPDDLYPYRKGATDSEALFLIALGEGLDRALEQERHFQSTLFLTEDFAEGRAAFLGKRQPQFKGG